IVSIRFGLSATNHRSRGSRKQSPYSSGSCSRSVSSRGYASSSRPSGARSPAWIAATACWNWGSGIACEVSGSTRFMADDEDRVKPSEQRGGTNVGDAEIRAKGEWVGAAADGIVPPELGGSDAPDSPLQDDPDYSDAALGETTGSDAPATT